MKRRCAIAGLVVAGAVSLLRADDFTLHSDVRLVQLDVSVKDKKGEAVAGLDRSNFTVLENGRPQTITVFGREDLPATLGILVDESYSTRQIRGSVLVAAEAFIGKCNTHDQFFVLNFNDRVVAGLPRSLPFSDNPAMLRSALRHGNPEGMTALYDAIADGLKHVQLGQSHRRALVLISDGGDNASSHNRREILQMVETIPATIYTIGLFDESDTETDKGLLKDLASISGGQAYLPKDSEEMLAACDRIAKDVRSRYTVGYVPSPDNGKGVRRIQVRVSASGQGRLTALTRRSYSYGEKVH